VILVSYDSVRGFGEKVSPQGDELWIIRLAGQWVTSRLSPNPPHTFLSDFPTIMAPYRFP